jgi:hypothetical protein
MTHWFPVAHRGVTASGLSRRLHTQARFSCTVTHLAA